MAVYEHLYGAYQGESQSALSRFFVIPRYALREIFKSKLLVTIFILCFIYPLVASILVYLHHNANALALLQIDVQKLLPIDASFFQTFVQVQGAFALILTNGTAPTVGIATATVNGKTEATLTFSGPGVLGGSLPDGRYTFRVLGAQVRDAADPAVAMGSERVETFHRLYGDSDGDRDVDNTDFAAFQNAFNNVAGTDRTMFDGDGDGDVDSLDMRQFTKRFGRVM